MKIKNIKWLTGSLMTAALAAGITACSDDHFDISSDAAGKQTIWQNIQANNDQLSEYADILQSVYYSQSEDKVTAETYADLLNGEQTFTIWAPVNGSFNYSYYKDLLKSGVRENIYKVEKELIRNNMTRYSNVINGTDSVKIDLFNSKSAWLNYGKQTLKGVAIRKANIGASNGVLHITSAAVEYQPNLYEYLASRADLDSINTFIKSFQTNEFDENASAKGPTIDGKITYVDSVTYLSNDYTQSFMNAYLDREDSSYAMVIPTNEAWKSMLEKTRKYFNFKSSYKQDINTQTETGADTLIQGVETAFTQAEIDSLNNLYAKNAICQNLAFNAKWQYEQIPITTIADIQAADARQDSLHSTAFTKFKKTGTLNQTNKALASGISNTVEVDNFANIFGNADPVEVSNGYAYVVNNFAFPFKSFAPDIDELYYESCDNMCEPYTTTKTYTRPTVIIDGDTVKSDSTFKYTYLAMKNKSTSSHPGAYFRVPQVLSCKYDIYVVIGYNTDYNLQNKFYAYISYDNAEKRLSDQRLHNMNEGAVDAQGESIYDTDFFVNRGIHYNDKGEIDYTDTICIAKDFEFPVCYAGLTSAYPVINIKSSFKSTEKAFYSREIWVNSIILKSKEW